MSLEERGIHSDNTIIMYCTTHPLTQPGIAVPSDCCALESLTAIWGCLLQCSCTQCFRGCNTNILCRHTIPPKSPNFFTAEYRVRLPVLTS